MAADPVDDFARELSERYRLHFDAALDRSRVGGDESRLRRVWETSFLSSHDFADEVAAFARLDRIAYAQMKEAEPLVSSFSRRFLRQTFVFPFADGAGPRLARGRRSLGPGHRARGRTCARRPRVAGGRRLRRHRPRPARDAGRGTDGNGGDRRRRAARRYREPARPRQRRAGRARGQRPHREGDRHARERHPCRTLPQADWSCACASTACCVSCPRRR